MEENRENPQVQSSRMLLPTIVLVAVAVIGYMISRPPLKSARPTGTPTATLPTPPSGAGLTATFSRLWQDPFEATYPATTDTAQSWLPQILQQQAAKVNVQRVMKDLVQSAKESGRRMHVVPVFLPGGPYADDREQRMRIRYAVLSALGATGYRLALPTRMTFVETTIFSYIRAANEFKELRLKVPLKLYNRDTVSPASKGWAKGKSEQVLVLWLNETQLGDMPLNAVKQVLVNLFPGKIQAELKLSLVGPTNSDMLLAMSRETVWRSEARAHKKEKSFLEKVAEQLVETDFRDFTIYSPRATISPEDLTTSRAGELREFTEPKLEPQRRSQSCSSHEPLKDVNVIRTIGTDRDLVDALARELKLRNAFPRDLMDQRHVVLVTERDTLYGRALRSAFSFDEDKEAGVPKDKLHVFTYLRGLDGELPNRNLNEKGGDYSAKNDQTVDRPVGRSQIDYLRRMAQQIEQLQERLNSSGEGEIKAVGVMGTDVYDKLLVFRALRSRFPRALFFTTDLDSALVHSDERPHTRNVLVASHFGLQLHSGLQRDAPKFRDSYQTGLYFTMLLVLGDETVQNIYSGQAKIARADPWRTRSTSIEESSNHFLKPLVFEIARSGPYQLTTTGGRYEVKQWRNLVKQRGNRGAVAALVQPVSPREIAAHRAPKRWILALLGVLLLWSTVAAFHNKCREKTGRVLKAFLHMRRPWKASWTDAGIVISVLALASFIMLVFWDAYLSDNGEPWEWVEGISVWPTSLLRLVAAIFAAALLAKSFSDLKKNEAELGETFSLAQGTFDPDKRFKERWRRLYKRTIFPVALFRLWLLLVPRARPADRRRPPGKKWTWYLERSTWKSRALRVIPAGLLFYLAGIITLNLWGYPFQPARGTFSSVTTSVILQAAVILTIVLLFFVLDSIQLCRGFISMLTRESTPWHNPAKILANRGAKYPPKIARELLDVRLTAELTQSVGKLVLYPFFVLFLMIVSRVKIFDNWDIPWSLLLIFVIMFASIIWATLSVRNTADKGRKHVLARLRDGLAVEAGKPSSNQIAQYELAIREVQNERRGSYRPLIEDPIVRALVIPFGGVGGVILIEQLARVL